MSRTSVLGVWLRPGRGCVPVSLLYPTGAT